MVRERLLAFHERRGCWSNHILFYRDGVSESQYGMVKTQEIPQIEDAIVDLQHSTGGRSLKPSLTLLVVGKRHHMRFYPEAPNDEASLGPGHVVDTEVIIPHAFNFYLQSHDSLLGTARAAHYVVLVDDSKYGGADLQKVVSTSCDISCPTDERSSQLDERSMLIGLQSYVCSISLSTRQVRRLALRPVEAVHEARDG